jgi:hypothetical protein
MKNINRMQSVSAWIGIQDLPKTSFNGPANLFWVEMLETKIARKAFDWGPKQSLEDFLQEVGVT